MKAPSKQVKVQGYYFVTAISGKKYRINLGSDLNDNLENIETMLFNCPSEERFTNEELAKMNKAAREAAQRLNAGPCSHSPQKSSV